MRSVRGIAVGLLAVGLALGAVACSDDGGKDDGGGGATTGGTTAGGATGTTAAGGGVQALVDIVECENDGGSGTASGTVLNNGSEAVAFEVEMGFEDSDSGERITTGKATTEVAEPGDEVEWSVEVDGLGDAEVECGTVKLEAAGGG